jgi:hypothetical protein
MAIKMKLYAIVHSHSIEHVKLKTPNYKLVSNLQTLYASQIYTATAITT